MKYNSCSELLVDTEIHDSSIALERFRKMFERFGWWSEPELSIEELEKIKSGGWIFVFDGKGNSCYLEYGDNGYKENLGFRFDAGGSHWNESVYPIFKGVCEELGKEPEAHDGGSVEPYLRWLEEN